MQDERQGFGTFTVFITSSADEPDIPAMGDNVQGTGILFPGTGESLQGEDLY